MAVEGADDETKTVWVAPITRTSPEDRETAIEIPIATKRRLGLGADRSWIVLSEVNRFEWPGLDLRPVVQGKWAYGLMPVGLFRTVRDRLSTLAGDRRIRQVNRDP